MAFLRIVLALAALSGGAAATGLGPQLLDATTEPTVHRGVAPPELIALDDLLRPFAGGPTIAVRVHHDEDAKKGGGVADAMVSALRRDGLPEDPKEAAAIVADSKVPLSIALQFEHLEYEAWPAAIQEIVAPFGDTSVRAEADGGLLVHAYLSSPGAAALPAHEDLGDIIVLQLIGEKTWNFASEYPTLAPGDGLALPSGSRHSARATSEGPSVHLTIHRISPDQVATRRRLDEDDDPRFSCFASEDASCGACRDENGEVDCDDCVYCTDADTVCKSNVPEEFNDDKNICCLSAGYRIERADDNECENLYDDVDPDDLDEGDDGGFSENELFCETSDFSKKECKKYSCCSWDGGCDYSGGTCPVTKVKRDKCKSSKKDDEDWSYFTTDGNRQTCNDVAKKPQKRCARIGDNLVPAKDACCKACQDYDDCEWSRTSGGCQKASSSSSDGKDDSKCKYKDGKDDSKWFYKKEKNDCKWAKRKGKCGKEGEDRKGRTRTGYESCCKSCKS